MTTVGLFVFISYSFICHSNCISIVIHIKQEEMKFLSGAGQTIHLILRNYLVTFLNNRVYPEGHLYITCLEASIEILPAFVLVNPNVYFCSLVKSELLLSRHIINRPFFQHTV